MKILRRLFRWSLLIIVGLTDAGDGIPRQVLGYLTTTNATYDGKYTLAIPGAANSAVAPGGSGYALVNIVNGKIKATGSKLADGSAFSQVVQIGTHGEWPLYNANKLGGNVIMGVLTVDTNESTISGTLTWDKLALGNPTTSYPSGFTLNTPVEGAEYSAAAFGANPVLTSADYALATQVTNTLGKFTFNKSLVKKLSVVATTGKVLAGITAGAAAGEGVMLGTTNAYGYLLNSTNGISSAFELQ